MQLMAAVYTISPAIALKHNMFYAWYNDSMPTPIHYSRIQAFNQLMCKSLLLINIQII